MKQVNNRFTQSLKLDQTKFILTIENIKPLSNKRFGSENCVIELYHGVFNNKAETIVQKIKERI